MDSRAFVPPAAHAGRQRPSGGLAGEMQETAGPGPYGGLVLDPTDPGPESVRRRPRKLFRQEASAILGMPDR